MSNESKTLWHGRYQAETDESLRKLNDSLPFDKRMWQSDIIGSRAYAAALNRAGIISQDERDSLINGLNQVEQEFIAGMFAFAAGDEDIHTAVERRLRELVGAPGGKLHTGRSRNDQVATDIRLYLAKAVERITDQLVALQTALTDQASEHLNTLIPGYTHLRAAQPVTVAHWLMSFFWMISRDVRRFDACHDAVLISPLGSGALAGTPYPIDRASLASDMGFNRITENSLDGVSDRDFIVEFLSAASLLMVHLSRFAEDVIIYSSPQFGYIKLDERFTTGSSLMPQKQNPDVLELVRGKAGRIAGHLSGLLNTLKGLPSTYNKDMQEDKEPLFDAMDNLETILPALIGLIHTMKFDADKMLAGLDEGMLATDVADYLVAKGIPFREAHGLVGQAVRRSLDTDTPMSKLPLEDYKSIHAVFDTDVYAVFDFAASVAKRKAAGGTAPDAVQHQIDQARVWLHKRNKS
jgi:argininosuccinate lyase